MHHMHDILLRRARVEDAVQLSALHTPASSYEAMLQLPFPSPALWQQRITTCPDNQHQLVAERAGEILGLISLTQETRPRRSHTASIGIIIKDSARGQGIGSALLRAAIDLAENWLRVRRIELTVYTDNEHAQALYAKHGFEIEGRFKNYAFRHGHYVDVYSMARVVSPE
ncbi:GNAT family N-acetyltransferase [Craterilacuibacter sp. RT1T]|uniref:GNAT family N-acetyltransferase n=1 Tax=Craterilacuibacter sp. RT1T TaxID=2942211 RepID=UPI0032E009EB|nr:GNAT family N-acetyltransferase [Craterilacuibacter sp. RT1T]